MLYTKCRKCPLSGNTNDTLEYEDIEEITRLIRDGFTSGILDNGEGKTISWTLSTEEYEE